MSDSIQVLVNERAGGACELCGAGAGLEVWAPEPAKQANADYALLVCEVCRTQMDGGELTGNHWYCLKESI